ncbi:hypothetical protein U0035_04810 [Niabella yanshanensis]|uniref:Lipoprotein n=1 Tax=Niabella yanshanensis TaxID=577386 RepID=A0ABZ0W8J1_9BACT|nr:hypothetical protein [Niabella yanshanensis]WQD39466.1 hypothetical protein U0035_04810 [Niabella yanshanensis]
MRLSIVSTLFIGLVMLACNKNSRVNDDCESGCKPNRVCTEEFRSLIVQVIDGSHAEVALDSFVVVRLRDSQLIINNDEAATQTGITGGTGRYLIFSDSKINETSRCGEDFEFRGYINKQSIANRVYTIAHDCCHINLISGDTKIIIDK